MSVFVYEGRKPDGSLVRDEIQAHSVRKATQALQEQQLTIISIKEKQDEDIVITPTAVKTAIAIILVVVGLVIFFHYLGS